MDCRTARALSANEELLTPAEREQLLAHRAQCAACHDDAHDPLGRALSQTMIEMALPPPDFTARLLARLPSESPLELARRERQQQQWRRAVLGTAAALVLLALALGGVWLQSAAIGAELGLIAQIVQHVMAALATPLLLLVASAGVVVVLLRLVVRRPGPIISLGGAALATALLIGGGALVGYIDRANAQRSTDVATLAHPIQAENVRGNVASVFGDIDLGGTVQGNVGSLFGNVTIRSGGRVAGDVLAGIGRIEGASGRVAGTIYGGSGAAVLSSVLGDNTTTISPAAAQSLAALLGALMTLALAGMVVMLWPQRTERTSAILPLYPWTALGIGVLITVLLALLALPVLALLALTVVGLLLTPLVLLAVHLAYVQGLAAVGQALGRRLTGQLTIGSALWGVGAQLVLVLLLGLISPIAGLCAFYLLASLGLGAQLLDRRSLI